MMSEEFLIVSKRILPAFLDEVIKCRELVEVKGMSVSEACKLVSISRSTYYKYKDAVYEMNKKELQKAIISCSLEDKKGVLSNVLNNLFNIKANIITINQNMPINQIAFITITIDIKDLSVTIDELINAIKGVEGVKQASLVAIE